MPVTNPLLRYSAAATAFLAGAIPVQGQMVFTDVDLILFCLLEMPMIWI